MREATDVGRKHRACAVRGQALELALAQLQREFGLQHRVGAGRTAAQVLVAHRSELGTQRTQQPFDRAVDRLRMLQGARWMECERLVGYPPHQRRDPLGHRRQVLGEVARRGHHALGTRRIHRVIAQQVRIVLDHRAASGGVDHDRLGLAARERFVPGVDVAAGIGQRAFVVVEVVTDRAAAARTLRHRRRDTQTVEHARGGGIDAGHHRRLHAAVKQQHAARVPRARPASRVRAGGHLAREHGRQQRSQHLTQAHRRVEQPAPRESLAQRLAQQALRQRPLHLLVDEPAADVDQVPVLDARRAGGLAVAAGEATVEMGLRRRAGGHALHHLLDQVDAPPRAVALVAQQLIGGAGRGAEAAVHAAAQDALGRDAVGRVLEPIGEVGFHRMGEPVREGVWKAARIRDRDTSARD